jgi:holo-[acyl-carrier protein] synthase
MDAESPCRVSAMVKQDQWFAANLNTTIFRFAPEMVTGIGTDIIEVGRIAESIARFGERFLRRIYTPGEIAYCRARQKSAAQSFAARFAAKEAAAKALGTGISRGVSWQELEVTRTPGQAPQLRLSGRAAERAKELGVARVSLSLTHAKEIALAVVIMES